jgi:molybdopterin-containing oxidoreductase family molybdopterin binding subunit
MAESQRVRTVCDPNCHANPRCGITAHVQDGRITRIEAGSFPLAEYDRRICTMGLSRLEQQYHPDRLRFPLKRVGARGEGKWQPISWDEAFDFIAEQLSAISRQFGSRSLAFFTGSGAGGVLTRGAAHRFAAAIGGTAHRPGGVDYGVPKGLEYTFGVPAATYFRPGGHEFADAVNSQLILLWGGNAADTRLVDFQFILDAQRRGVKIVCIDPNCTTTAEKSDQWISPRPGTDTALALSLLHEILEHDLHDEPFLLAHTNASFLVRADTGRFLKEADVIPGGSGAYMVWDRVSQRPLAGHEARAAALAGKYHLQLTGGHSITCAPAFELMRDLARSYPVERAAAITTVAAKTIRDLAREFATRKPAAIRIGYGVDRWYYSDYTARAAANLAIVTANIGVAGGGISVHDGTYAAPLNLNSFRAPDGREAATLNVISLMQAIEHGIPYPVKALWLSASNMFNQTAANRARVLSAIVPRLALLVVVDQFMTDTANAADIVLPACTIFEKTDLVAGMFMQLQRPAVAPEGESKADFDIFAGLAARMGLGHYFDRPAEEYLREICASDHPLLRGVSLDRLQREDAILLNRPPEPYVPFTDFEFKTPSGRIEIYKEELVQHRAELPYHQEPIEASPENPLHGRFPLTLLFSHSRHRIHSSFANLPRMKALEPEPMIELHPLDAQRRKINSHQFVRVWNERGQVIARCKVNASLRPGVVVIAEGSWVKDFAAGDPYSLTHERVSPTSENYAFFDTLVEVEAAADFPAASCRTE